MGLLPEEIMPVDDDETYVKHIYAITIGWTLLVIVIAITVALLAL